MKSLFTLVVHYARGGYDHYRHASLDEALNALDDLPCADLTNSFVEVCRGDQVWKLDNHNAIFRPFELTPA